MNKPKIVLIVDQPDWAFAISANDMVKNLGYKYEFKILNYNDKLNDIEHYIGADLVYLFGYYMIDWIPKEITNICAGVRAIYDLDDTDRIGMLKRVPSVHVVSEPLVEKVGKLHDDVHYACHGVDTDFFSPVPKKKKNKLVLGWAGNRANKEKNFDLLDVVCRERDDVELKVVSYGEDQADRKGMRKFYSSIDAYILPSNSEGNSATIFEAMACGLPIISTDSGDWKDICEKTNGGLVIKPTIRGLNEAIDEIKNSNLEKMGDSNRKEAVRTWSWKKKAKEFEKFFDKCLKTTSKNKTIDTFSAKWDTMPDGYGSRSKEQVEFFQRWAVKKYGLNNLNELHEFYKSKKKILEVGIGSCFNIKYISKFTDADITGCDLSEVVCNKAKKIFENENKIKIVHKDLMNIEDKYDLIIADGVLHHTPNTEAAVKHLYGQLEEKGIMYAYIYRKMGPIREFTNDWVRDRIKGMSESEKMDYVKPLTDIGRELSKIEKKIFVNSEIFGLEPGMYTPQELFYYGVIKCFWNDSFSYEENNLNNYDWFAPEHAWRHTDEEVLSWFKGEQCVTKINDSNPNGISLTVEKLDE